MKKHIRNHFWNLMGDELDKLRINALYDLYYGPIPPNEEEDWPGYTAAIKQLEAWADENITDVWYDLDCGDILLSEPSADHDEEHAYNLEHVVHVDSRQVKELVFQGLATDGGMNV